MAKFTVHGFDELSAAFKKAYPIPEETTTKMLKSMGQKTKQAIERTAASMLQGVFATGTTQRVMRVNKPKLTDTGGSVTVTFSGSRERGKTKTRNAEIAYINEFGKKGQAARPFVKTAKEQDAEKINQAGADVFYSWLDKTGL